MDYGIKRQFVIEGVVLTIIGIIGIVGNIGAVQHFAHKKRFEYTFYALMLVLAAVDILIIVSFIWFCSVPEFLNSTKQSHYWSVWIYPIQHTLVTSNICLTVAISLDRYLAICQPLRYNATSLRLKHILLSISIFSIIYNIPRYFELEWINLSVSEVPHMKVWPTNLRTNPKYVELYMFWCRIIILGALPMMLLMGLNVLTVKELTKYKSFQIGSTDEDKEREIQVNMAHINVALVVVFIVCHVIVQIPCINELIQRHNNHERVTGWKDKQLFHTIGEVSQTMMVLNSSVNFYVYLIKRKMKQKMEQG